MNQGILLDPTSQLMAVSTCIDEIEKMSVILYWFRQDLRLRDNPALYHAAQDAKLVIPIYIFDNTGNPNIRGAQKWWLHHSLFSLQKDLLEKGVSLVLKRGDSLKILLDVIKLFKVDALYYNRSYDPSVAAKDIKINTILDKNNIKYKIFSASLLHEPDNIKNKQGANFKVFTHYWNNIRKIPLRALTPLPKFIQKFTTQNQNLDLWGLLPKNPNWANGFDSLWKPGEFEALKKLRGFINQNLLNYKINRDFPDQSGTSLLSPHLHFGEISLLQIWQMIQNAMLLDSRLEVSGECFLSELGWRDFSYYLLHHFPNLTIENFQKKFDTFPWEYNDKHLIAWQKGKTGYPIIDAGMRELWHTGYMHNRVRMIVASFLTKDLLIHWKEGAAWFWDTLLDADLAVNVFNWQWVAGCGADAAPYFRIFNPVLQGQKFDPNGNYVKKWVKELKELPEKYVHHPWEAPREVLIGAGVRLGHNYPLPIVDHRSAREKALRLAHTLKGK